VQVMVANIRCEEIMVERLAQLREDEEWQALAGRASQHLVAEFGLLATALLKNCLSGVTPPLCKYVTRSDCCG